MSSLDDYLVDQANSPNGRLSLESWNRQQEAKRRRPVNGAGTLDIPTVDASVLASELGGDGSMSNSGWYSATCPSCGGQGKLGLFDADSGLKMKCLRGCEARDVYKAIAEQCPHIDIAALGSRAEAIYAYGDRDGQPLFRVRKYRKSDGDKGFSQERLEGDRWVPGIEGLTQRPLYLLPQLLQASPDADVFVVEGEKDVQTLAALGLVATTSAQGAGSWHLTDPEPLAGRSVVVVLDHDDAGYKYAAEIARWAVGKVTSLRVVALPGLELKGDVTDWLEAGHTKAELLALVADAPAWSESEFEGRIAALLEKAAYLEAERKAAKGIGDGRKPIAISSGDLNTAVRASAELLRNDLFRRGPLPVLLVRGGDLRAQGRPSGSDGKVGGVKHSAESLIMIPPTEEAIKFRLNERARYISYDGRKKRMVPVDCPSTVAAALTRAATEVGLRTCRGIVAVPLLGEDGVITTPGYNEQHGVYLDLPDELPAIPERPTKDEALAALDVLLQPFVGYYEHVPQARIRERLRCSIAAAALTAVARPSLPTAPMVLVDASTPGAGKTKLAQALGCLASGTMPSLVTEGYSREELTKRIDAALISGVPAILIDNITGTVAISNLESHLTAEFTEIRSFGTLTSAKVACSALIIMTANNAQIRFDLLRRSLTIRLVVEDEQPELRAFDFDPVRRTQHLRPQLVAAALTVLRAWSLARSQDDTGCGRTVLGSFADWSSTVAGAVEWLTGLNPIQFVKERKEADPEEASRYKLFKALRDKYGGEEWTAAQALAYAAQAMGSDEDTTGHLSDATLREAIQPRDGRVNPHSLGKWLFHHRDRTISGLRLVGVTNRKKGTRWRVLEGKGEIDSYLHHVPEHE